METDTTFLDRDACYRAVLARDRRFDGRFFTAVRTTGIYCRPICPARPPLLKNVIFLPSAAAAQQAGFRPCLRCRPETAPDIAAWHGTRSSVTRALGLIAAGALDEADTAALAARLGLGERQLRRLFREHLGASPASVARTRRLLFAKQLITETDLPMTEVAHAAGFGSLRRFNHAVGAVYGAPPSRLRRRPGHAGPGITLTLATTTPYDWPGLIGFLAARAIPGVEHVTPDRYARTIALDGQHGWIAVRPHGDALSATIHFAALRALPSIVERLRLMFDTQADIVRIGRDLSADPHLARLVVQRPGLRVPGAWDGFELAVRAILGQQITVAAATRLAGKLVALLGTPVDTDDPALHHLFPSPDRLAGVELGPALGMPRPRGAALSAMAAAAAPGLFAPGLFGAGQGLEAAIQRLVALPGIGAWTAHYIAMRALREPDAFPAADIGLMRALATPTGRPSVAELTRRAEAWRPWRAYAALHLWTSDAASAEAPHAPPHPEPHPVPDRRDSARL